MINKGSHPSRAAGRVTDELAPRSGDATPKFKVWARSASVDVSPRHPAVLGANGLPDLPVSVVADPIEANVLVLGQDKATLLLISFDLLYVGDRLRRAIESRLQGIIAPDRIFLAASHTHRGPMLDDGMPGLGSFSYTAFQTVVEIIGDVIVQLLRTPAREVSVDVSYGDHSAGVNRRLRRFVTVNRSGVRFNTVSMAPNPSGPNDTSIRRLRFLDATGAPIAEIWSSALHPTAFPFRDRISADFPGHVRRAIRSRTNAKLPVLFFQGFSGDIRPRTPTNGLGFRRLLQGRRFADFSLVEYDEWVSQLATDVLDARWKTLEGEGVASVRLPVDRDSFVIGGPPPVEGWLHALRLGDLAILGVPSEVVTEYSSSLVPVPPITDIWGVGCIDQVWGYAPTEKMLAEGGYESRGFCPYFGVKSVSPRVERELRANLRTMASLIAQS